VSGAYPKRNPLSAAEAQRPQKNKEAHAKDGDLPEKRAREAGHGDGRERDGTPGGKAFHGGPCGGRRRRCHLRSGTYAVRWGLESANADRINHLAPDSTIDVEIDAARLVPNRAK
jgi:hypothetical protein